MFKPSLLSAAIATTVALLSHNVVAQEIDDAEDEALEEVIVTGIRASLSKALDYKRENIQVVESIVAEDIGKFPDNNVVEALQRVPGVQVTDRASGEVNSISIRGLTDITTTINGRQTYISSGRFYTMADTPASLISRVDVYKTRSADKISSGIAGQVDIITQRPFNFDGSKVVVAGRGIYQDQEGSFDPSLSVLLSDRWNFDFGELGVLVNLANSQSNFRDQSITSGAAFPYFTRTPEGQGLDRDGNFGEFQPYGRISTAYWTPGLQEGLSTAPGSTINTEGTENEYILARDAVFASDFSGYRERPAANLSVQFAPNETSEYLFEAFYNGYRADHRNSLFFTFPDSNYNTNFDDAVTLYEGTNIVKERTVYGNPEAGIWQSNFNSTDAEQRQTDTYLYAIGGNWDITDNFHLEAEASTQKSVFKSEFFAIRLLRDYYAMSVDFNNGDGVPALTFLDNPSTSNIDEADLLDPNQYTMGPSWDNGHRGEGTSDQFRVDADWKLDFHGVKELSFGLLYEEHGANEMNRGASIASYIGDKEVANMDPAFLTSTSNFFDGRAEFPTGWLIGDSEYLFENRDALRSLYGYYDEDGIPVDNYLDGGNHMQLEKSFEVMEKTTDFYIQAQFEYQVPGGSIDGSAGVRYTDAETDVSFARKVPKVLEDDGSETPAYLVIDNSVSNTDKLLPTLVLRYNFLDDYMLRFAYTETIRRPDFGALNSHVTYFKDVTGIGYGTAAGGNPNLQPVTSQNLDLSLEYYFGDGNAIYGTLFQRNIEGLVFNSLSDTFYNYPDDYELNSDGSPVLDEETGMPVEIGEYRHVLSSPDNTSNGELSGMEIGLVYFPDNLPTYLDGAGIQASYTALESSQQLPQYDADGSLTGYLETEMFGVSNNSFNIVLAYEKENFGARLSYVWRDAFRQRNEAPLFANPLAIYRRAETSMDFQLSYNVTDDFVITFDATNLTDQKFQEYYEDPELFNFYSGIYSRTYALGARYSF